MMANFGRSPYLNFYPSSFALVFVLVAALGLVSCQGTAPTSNPALPSDTASAAGAAPDPASDTTSTSDTASAANPAPASSASSSSNGSAPDPSSPPTSPPPTLIAGADLDNQSIFQGEGFIVTITGVGSGATYRGCNANQECLDIPQVSHYSQGVYTWENDGHSYVLAPVGMEVEPGQEPGQEPERGPEQNLTPGQYTLRVFRPDGETIVDATLQSIEGNLGLNPTVLAEFYAQIDTLGACGDFLELEASRSASLAYTVNGDDAIVEVLCFFGAYQGGYEYWFYETTDETADAGTGSEAEFIPLSFDTYTAPESTGRSRIQVQELSGLPTYDPDQELLTIFQKYRGLSDCGSYSEYEWRGTGFELLTYRVKDECDGNALDPLDYPQIYPPS